MNPDISKVFGTTFDMFKRRFWPMLGLYVIFFVLSMVYMLVVGGVLGGSSVAAAGLENPLAMGVGFIFGMLVLYLGIFVIAFAQSLSLNAMATPLRETSFGEAFGDGWRGVLTMLGIMVLFGIAYFVFVLIFGIIAGVMGAVSETMGGIVAILLVILIVPVAVYLFCRLSVLSPVVAVDKVYNPISAIKRCWELTRGKALGIFVIMLVFWLVAMVVFGLLLFMFFGSIFAAASAGAEAPAVGGMLVGLFVFLIIGVLFALVNAALVSSLHGELVGYDGSLSNTFE